MNTYTYRGREHKVFTFHAFGQRHRVIITHETYASNGTLALRVLEIVSEGPDTYLEPWGMLTMNVEADGVMHQGEKDAFVKNYSENEGWAENLASLIGTEQGVWAHVGHALAPLYEFDLEKIYA